MITPALIEDPNDQGTYLIQSFSSDQYNGGGSSGPISSGPGGIGSGSTPGSRIYETGIERGVLYPDGLSGVAWNGLVSVTEKPSGGAAKPYYIDGVKYLNRSEPEEFEATIDAYTYPDEFAFCDGSASMAAGLFISQQARKSFGMAYQTRIGNDIKGLNYGRKIHIIYNAMATPATRKNQTFTNEVSIEPFSWDISTRPVKFEDPYFGVRYGSHLVIDSRFAYPWAMDAVEKVIFGDAQTAAKLPTPRELLDLFVDNAILKVTDNGDGTWTATGPDEAISMLSDTEFQIAWPSAVPIDADSYTISSL